MIAQLGLRNKLEGRQRDDVATLNTMNILEPAWAILGRLLLCERTEV